MKKFLAMILALALALSVTTLSWADTPAEMDLDAFIKAVVAANYNYDGNGVTVKWSPVTGCYDTREGHTCTANSVTATGNTPKRVNSGLTQFQIFEGANVAVTVKNVNFIYTPAGFTVCENSNWKGTFTADQAPAGQLYFMNSGDFTFENCTFDKVVLTNFNGTGTSKVINCEFANVYNNYAIKDIRGANINVTGCTIKDCGGGIMVSQTSADTAVQIVNISNNAFENVDSESTAASGKAGTRGLIQLASSGKYDTAAITLNENFADENCGPVLRQLNNTADISKVQGDLSGLLYGSGTLTTTTGDRDAPTVTQPTVHTVRFNMNGHGDDFYKQIADDTTITLFAPNSGSSNIVFKNWMANGQTYNADDTYEVKGNVEFTAVWQDNTPAPRYYYNSTTTTDTKADGTKGSPKTFDAGMGIYALTAVLSVTGMAYVGKKKF